MIKNYLTVAIRNLMRHKLYTSINVLGLAIGLACGILILLYIQQEFAINRSHTLGDRIYKVIREQRGQYANNIHRRHIRRTRSCA